MLDTLISGLCQGSSGALREKAGQLVGEWLKWSSKHVTTKSSGEPKAGLWSKPSQGIEALGLLNPNPSTKS
jgi:hypothetical protein